MKQDNFRTFNLVDGVIGNIDRALNNIFCPQTTQRQYPASSEPIDAISAAEKKQVAALMRVNHAGEMAAQALYQGQSLIARDKSLQGKLYQASVEESDHLNWCRTRLEELGEKPSLFDPLWYAGSFAIGITAGAFGDRWNLGFLAETEKKVVRHLDAHLQSFPGDDVRSRAIVAQMKIDEQGHADLADALGAAKLPGAVQSLMQVTSKVMTSLAAKI